MTRAAGTTPRSRRTTRRSPGVCGAMIGGRRSPVRTGWRFAPGTRVAPCRSRRIESLKPRVRRDTIVSSRTSFSAPNRALALCGTIVVASACALARGASSPLHDTAGLSYGVLATSGLVGATLAWKRCDRSALIIVLVVALAARVALFASPPVFSHDAYRYLWDGRVMLGGHDPLALAPNSPALATLAHDPLFGFIDLSRDSIALPAIRVRFVPNGRARSRGRLRREGCHARRRFACHRARARAPRATSTPDGPGSRRMLGARSCSSSSRKTDTLKAGSLLRCSQPPSLSRRSVTRSRRLHSPARRS